MYAIETQGPVSAGMQCPNSFMNYGGGVYQNLNGDTGGGGGLPTLRSQV